jgi:hypothetical protein
MGQAASIPSDLCLHCILCHWAKFDPQTIKKQASKQASKQANKQTKKPLIFPCNVAWPAYKLPDQEVWPQNNTLKHSTIFQPDLFCCNFSKYSEVPYVQAFMSLSKNWDLWEGHRSNESCPDSVFPEDLNLSPYFVSSGNLLG